MMAQGAHDFKINEVFVLGCPKACVSAQAGDSGCVAANDAECRRPSFLRDEFGEPASWIEIENTSYSTHDIRNCFITTDKAVLDKKMSAPEREQLMSIIPAGDERTLIKARQRITFFVGNRNRGTLHTTCAVNLKAGEENWIALYDGNAVDLLGTFAQAMHPRLTTIRQDSAAMGAEAERLLVDAGTVSAQALQSAVRQQEYGALPEALAEAIQQAGDTLGATQDPQRCDFILDRAYWAQLSSLAKESESAMLAGYVARMIDCANLKAAVRSLRLGKPADFMRGVLVPGGNYAPESLLQAAYAGTLDTACSAMGQAAQLAPQAARGNQVTAFEKACDDYLTGYLQGAKLTPFGDSVIIAYLAAREAEFTAVRVIMAGRFAGLETDTIRERLRESYV